MKIIKNKITIITFVFLIIGSFLIVNAFSTSTPFINIGGIINVNFNDKIKPVIIENPGLSKEMFVLQAKELDFSRYVTVSDNSDSNISSKIEILMPENFYTAGEHTITYRVKDRAGNVATYDLKINIWTIIKIESGQHHVMALTSHGKVYTWGNNISGQIGDGTVSAGRTPKLVAEMENVIDIAAGIGSSYALKSDGTIFSWGYNAYGKLGDGSAADRHSPVPVQIPLGIKFKKLSSNYYNAAAIAEDGSVYSWGYAGYGADGSGNATARYIPTKTNLTNIANISMGNNSGVAINNEGRIYTWGSNYYGSLGNGGPMSAITHSPSMISLGIVNGEEIKVKQVSAGDSHVLAISTDGDVFAWGRGTNGQLGIGSTSNQNIPRKISFPKAAVEVIASDDFSAVRLEDGNLYFFGANTYNQLGVSGNPKNTPQLLEKALLPGSPTNLALGLYTSSILLDDSVVYSMGYNTYYNFGNNSTSNSLIPVSWSFAPPTIV